jgi:hypothetical protein
MAHTQAHCLECPLALSACRRNVTGSTRAASDAPLTAQVEPAAVQPAAHAQAVPLHIPWALQVSTPDTTQAPDGVAASRGEGGDRLVALECYGMGRGLRLHWSERCVSMCASTWQPSSCP